MRALHSGGVGVGVVDRLAGTKTPARPVSFFSPRKKKIADSCVLSLLGGGEIWESRGHTKSDGFPSCVP